MPKVRLDDKFTYWNDSSTWYFVKEATTDVPNGDIWKPTDFPTTVQSNVPMMTPTVSMPTLGNTHSQRKGNRITVTSIRWKSIMTLRPEFLVNKYDPFSHSAPSVPDYPVTKRFFKMRYMMIQWDNDYVEEINPRMLYGWFKRTYCQYMNPMQTPTEDTWGGTPTAPVSVHSNVLHMTTPFTSKFNILCDKCFTVSTDKPQVSFDITIPLNKQYLFDEDDPTTLIYPCIWLVIFPPMARAIDIDPWTERQLWDWYGAAGGDSTPVPFITFHNFTKLSFVDL